MICVGLLFRDSLAYLASHACNVGCFSNTHETKLAEIL